MKQGIPIIIFLLFVAIAVTLWLTCNNLFYLFNFLYIGLMVSLGVLFWGKGNKHARTLVQIAVGLYMFVYLGIISRENMQIAGFWYYLLSGTFQAAVIHYLIAKILGPLIFGRGWCGYACWTAMLLDFLPFKIPEKPRKIRYSLLPHLFFVISLVFVLVLSASKTENHAEIMWISFILGNILYYIIGIGLAYRYQDNRAFCKYICPVTVFLKPASYFSLMRIRVDNTRCLGCGECERVCPMDVEIRNSRRNRLNGTDCILCLACQKICPQDAIQLSLARPKASIQKREKA